MPNPRAGSSGCPYWPLERALRRGRRLERLRAARRTCSPAARPAGGCARSGCARGAALAGGLAFALAPYRVMQSTGHLLGPISFLLPLALLGLERGRDGARAGWRSARERSSRRSRSPGSCTSHSARSRSSLVYALLPARERPAAPGRRRRAAAVVAGLIVQRAVIDGSLARAAARSARWRLLGRLERPRLAPRGTLEEFVLLGWVLPLLAIAGIACSWRTPPRLAALLGLGVVVPALLALGTNLPLYESALAPLPAAALPARARAAPADRLPGAGRARSVRVRPAARVRSSWPWPPRRPGRSPHRRVALPRRPPRI